MQKRLKVEVREGLAKEVGLPSAILLGFIYTNGKWTGNVKDLTALLGISYYTLRRARNKLKKLGYIREQRKGFPQRLIIEITQKGRKKFEC